MALTMTRTRTQTALTRIVELLANVSGELGFLDALLLQEHANDLRSRLQARHAKLLADRDSLFVVIRQFDPSIQPEQIGELQEWRNRFGNRNLSERTLSKRYLTELPGFR